MRPRVRRRILDFLADHPEAPTGQIARALGMATPAVRHHLAILRDDGRISSRAGDGREQRGRPEMRHRLAEGLQGDNVAMVADAALVALGFGGSPGVGQSMVSALSTALLEQFGQQPGRVPAASRLGSLVEALSRLHYAARWEAGREGPRLIFDHCPYAAIIGRHPELCRMDAAAVSAYTGADARQDAKISPHGPGATRCVFTLIQGEVRSAHGGS